MNSASGLNFEVIPGFGIFRDLVRTNIGYFPEFSADPVGLSGHRTRVFTNPPGAEIRFSERALARYIGITDVLFAAMGKRADFIGDCLCALAGGEYLITNRFQGLALLAHAFRRVLLTRVPISQTLDNVIRQSQASDLVALISLLLPLGHEIGHLPEAQALCPKAVMGDEFLETLRINYDRVKGFTGLFEYATSFTDNRSVLNLGTLRKEVAADYFATCAVATLFAQTSVGKEYPLRPLTFGLLIFPIAMAIDSICRANGQSARLIQETTLALECRYSVLIDGVRGCVKSFFRDRKNRDEIFKVIDDETDRVHKELYALQQLTWAGMVSLSEIANRVAVWNNDEVLKYAREAMPDVRQQISVANYISVLLGEVDAYPLSAENEASLRAYSDGLMTFDTAVIEDDNIRLIRGQ